MEKSPWNTREEAKKKKKKKKQAGGGAPGRHLQNRLDVLPRRRPDGEGAAAQTLNPPTWGTWGGGTKTVSGVKKAWGLAKRKQGRGHHSRSGKGGGKTNSSGYAHPFAGKVPPQGVTSQDVVRKWRNSMGVADCRPERGSHQDGHTSTLWGLLCVPKTKISNPGGRSPVEYLTHPLWGD